LPATKFRRASSPPSPGPDLFAARVLFPPFFLFVLFVFICSRPRRVAFFPPPIADCERPSVFLAKAVWQSHEGPFFPPLPLPVRTAPRRSFPPVLFHLYLFLLPLFFLLFPRGRACEGYSSFFAHGDFLPPFSHAKYLLFSPSFSSAKERLLFPFFSFFSSSVLQSNAQPPPPVSLFPPRSGPIQLVAPSNLGHGGLLFALHPMQDTFPFFFFFFSAFSALLEICPCSPSPPCCSKGLPIQVFATSAKLLQAAGPCLPRLLVIDLVCFPLSFFFAKTDLTICLSPFSRRLQKKIAPAFPRTADTIVSLPLLDQGRRNSRTSSRLSHNFSSPPSSLKFPPFLYSEGRLDIPLFFSLHS